jgi:hypothetical protein
MQTKGPEDPPEHAVKDWAVTVNVELSTQRLLPDLVVWGDLHACQMAWQLQEVPYMIIMQWHYPWRSWLASKHHHMHPTHLPGPPPC